MFFWRSFCFCVVDGVAIVYFSFFVFPPLWLTSGVCVLLFLFCLVMGDICKSTDELGTYVVASLCLLLPCVIYRQKSEDVRYALVFSWFFFVVVINHLYESYFPTRIGDNKKIKDSFWFTPMAMAVFPLSLGATKAVLMELLFFFGVAFCFWDAAFGSANIAAAAAVAMGLFGLTYLVPKLRHLAMKAWLSVVLTATYLVLVVAITADDTRECGARRNLFLLCSSNCSVITREYHWEPLPLVYATGSFALVFGVVFLCVRCCCVTSPREATDANTQRTNRNMKRKKGTYESLDIGTTSPALEHEEEAL